MILKLFQAQFATSPHTPSQPQSNHTPRKLPAHLSHACDPLVAPNGAGNIGGILFAWALGEWANRGPPTCLPCTVDGCNHGSQARSMHAQCAVRSARPSDDLRRIPIIYVPPLPVCVPCCRVRTTCGVCSTYFCVGIYICTTLRRGTGYAGKVDGERVGTCRRWIASKRRVRTRVG